MENYQHLSWDDIKAMYVETGKRFKETEQFIKNLSVESKETDKKIDKLSIESKETDKKIDKLRIESKKTDKFIKNLSVESKEIDRQLKQEMKNLAKIVGGMGNSNGEMAEEYFYNAFKADKTFANERYFKVRRNQIYRKEEIEAEFDIVLLNGKSAALIEVKYNAKPDNVSIGKIISKIECFKLLYPECKDSNIYLGVAAMSFRKGLEAKLHRAGIATISQVGKKMVKFDKDVKVF
jgi:hypothetical protein